MPFAYYDITEDAEPLHEHHHPWALGACGAIVVDSPLRDEVGGVRTAD